MILWRTILIALSTPLILASQPAWAEDPTWTFPASPGGHSHVVTRRRPHVVMARSEGHRGCPLGSEGPQVAWLVRGMPLANFHTNSHGQIVAGAPSRCN